MLRRLALMSVRLEIKAFLKTFKSSCSHSQTSMFVLRTRGLAKKSILEDLASFGRIETYPMAFFSSGLVHIGDNIRLTGLGTG